MKCFVIHTHLKFNNKINIFQTIYRSNKLSIYDVLLLCLKVFIYFSFSPIFEGTHLYTEKR